MKCSVAGCERPLYARGWCKAHYRRWERHGDPTGGGPSRREAGFARAWVAAHADHDGSDCLTWPFGRNPDGRAQGPAGANVRRWMCEAAHGPAPTPQHQAAHSCGKGHDGCISPQHLRWATATENAADKWAHGTAARLSEKQARDILRRYQPSRPGPGPQRPSSTAALAKEFGVSASTILAVVSGATWKHLTRPQVTPAVEAALLGVAAQVESHDPGETEMTTPDLDGLKRVAEGEAGVLAYVSQVLTMLVAEAERGPSGHGKLLVLGGDQWRCVLKAQEKVAALSPQED